MSAQAKLRSPFAQETQAESESVHVTCKSLYLSSEQIIRLSSSWQSFMDVSNIWEDYKREKYLREGELQ